jgi:hypothetical protein
MPKETLEPDEPEDFLRRILERLVYLSSLSLVIVFYFWTIVSNGRHPNDPSAFYYPHLADAFLKKQTYLQQKPEPELLELKDPYDPDQNWPYRLHDASLYKGKYYIYFGPTPAVLVFAPYRLLTRHDLQQRLAVFIFCSLGYIFSRMLFSALVRDHFPRTPLWLRVGAMFSLGLANACPFLLRRPDVYEVAISSAYGLLQLAFLCFYVSLKDPRKTVAGLFLVSFCIGAAVASRYNYLFAAGVFVLFLGWNWWWQRERKERLAWTVFVALVPIGAIGLALAWYNKVRFGSPFDFGWKYQLAGVEVSKITFTSIANLPYTIWYYFLSQPDWQATFPFVKLPPTPGPYYVFGEGHFFGLEKVAGLFVLAPVSIFALALPFELARLRAKEKEVDFKPLEMTLLFIAAATLGVLLPILCISGATMRYMVDFAPGFIFLGCIVMCGLVSHPPRREVYRWLQRDFFLLILFFGCWNGLMISFIGYYDWLRETNPGQYAALAHLFAPVSKIISLVLYLTTV